MKLSIVIPAHNEEKRIGRTLEEYSRYFDSASKKKKFTYEIIVVINNTKDDTEKVVRGIRKKNAKISYLNFEKGGKGFAITQGFKHALKNNSDIVGFVDADMATPPESFYALVNAVGKYDGAIANRYDPKSTISPKFTFRRIVVAKVFNLLVRGLFLIPYQDTQCGAKAFKRQVIAKTLPKLTITQWAFDIDLLYLAKKEGFAIYSCPTKWKDVEGSKINLLGTSIEMFFAVVQLRILHSRFSRLIRPLKKVVGGLYRLMLTRKP